MEKFIDLTRHQIRIHEPLAQALKGSTSETDFSLSLLDAARMSGHCCVAVTGAFLLTKAAVERLFPDGVCVRGDLMVELPHETTPSATGPVANVMSFITGAWGANGFAGLSGKHVRKGLLHLNCDGVPAHTVRFTRLSTGAAVLLRFHPELAVGPAGSPGDFADRVKAMVQTILAEPQRFVENINPAPAP